MKISVLFCQFVLISVSSFISGCLSLPDVNHLIEQSSQTSTQAFKTPTAPSIKDANGYLNKEQKQAILTRITTDTPKAFFEDLSRIGIQSLEFNPLNPLEARKHYSPNDRDHRKLLVVDGTTAIIGGVNLSKSYQSLPFHKRLKPTIENDLPAEYWRDTDIEIHGPGVAELQKLFIAHWISQKGVHLDTLKTTDFFPKAFNQGEEV